jgi:hypothetical protein
VKALDEIECGILSFAIASPLLFEDEIDGQIQVADESLEIGLAKAKEAQAVLVGE